MRSKTIQQSGYLIVKGLLKKKGNGDELFNVLDDLFDIPKPKQAPQKSKEDLIEEFSNFVKGA
jgi:hypothetical protein